MKKKKAILGIVGAMTRFFGIKDFKSVKTAL